MTRTSKGLYGVSEDNIPGLRTELNFILQYVADRLDALEVAEEAAAPAALTTETGLIYGEVYIKGNTTALTLNSATKVQIGFDTDGLSNGMTVDATENHITADQDGEYFVSVSCALRNDAAQSHLVSIGVFVNNGVTQKLNIHAHRSLSGGSTDAGSISLSGIVELSEDDTVELWANTDSASDRDVIFEDVTMSIIEVGIQWAQSYAERLSGTTWHSGTVRQRRQLVSMRLVEPSQACS